MSELFGHRLLDEAASVNDEIINKILSETFISDSNLYELTFGRVETEESDKFNSLTGINRFFGITLHMADELFGVAAIGLRPDQPDPDHETIRSFAYLSSLTLKRRKAEEDLREREDRLIKIVNSSQDAMIIMDASGNIYLWNLSAEKMFGYTANEVSGKNLHKLIAPSRYFSEHLKGFSNFVESGQGAALGKLIEIQAIKKNGEEFPIELALSAIRIDNSWFSVGAVRDITERKKAEEALIKNEKKYRELFDSNKDGVAVLRINPDNKIASFVEVNEAAANILGYTREELLAIPVNELDSEYTEQRGTERRTALIKNGSYSFESHFFHKSGRLIPVEVNASFINYDGIPSFLNIIRDISERKFREKLQIMQYNIANAMINANSLYALYEAVRDELSNIIDTTNFYVAFYNKETGMMQAPFEKEMDILEEWPADKSLSGYVVKQRKSLLLNKNQVSEMAEKGIINLIGTRSEKWLGVPLFSGKQAIGVMVVQSYDNPNAYNEDSKYVLELAAHELGNYISRKEAEQYAIKLSKAVEQNPISIVITDRDGIIEYVNPKFTGITGYSKAEAIGMKPSILKSGEHSTEFFKNLWNTITAGADWQGEMKNRKKDGSFYWENAVISPILNDEGVITNFVAVKEDITEKKKTIEELEKAKLKAEESDRLKTAFLQNISHEIRTPLNGILGFSELLIQDWTTPEEKAEYNEAIQISGRRLVEIVSNVLDISIIETRQVILNPAAFNLNSLMTDLYNFYRNQAIQKGLQLFYLPGTKDNTLTITADRARINQIFTNLINNAIKYTKKGTISFGYTLKNGLVVFNVSDTGIGINPAHHAMIFTRFYQADDTTARNYEGAGLGLSISQGLVKAMGGEIWFESEPDKGTSFSFSIPVPDIAEVPEVVIKAESPDTG
ncbi:MAG: PAS domain S-box protein, partial [Lentimicrobium sp.]|nr:PAS domain S-box protein [Lentimicrobium sp.]